MSVRILLVEDHVPTRELIREYLEREPQVEIVAETASGGEAVLLAEQHRPDVVVMDLSLPEMDGLKASQRIARVSPASQIVMVTNYAFDDLRERARDMYGASAFLAKEEIPTRLVPVITSLVKASTDKRQGR